MTSTNVVDFSVRQNKAIERSVAFDGLARLLHVTGEADYRYIGLGSVWFVDFDMAHRRLGIRTMVSIEADDVTAHRASFNKPYRTIEVIHGHSQLVIPDDLLLRRDLVSKPWIVWLDYDKEIDVTRLDELRVLTEKLPENSILLVTFNAQASRYGKIAERRAYLESLFGPAFPSRNFPTSASTKDPLAVMHGLAEAVLSFLGASAYKVGRPGEFIPAFNLRYQDGSPMVTVGGVLPSPQYRTAFETVIGDTDWMAMPADPIMTPPLTAKEAATLRALLPGDDPLTRSQIRALGFDLREEQLASFQEHYLNYPLFIQAVR